MKQSFSSEKWVRELQFLIKEKLKFTLWSLLYANLSKVCGKDDTKSLSELSSATLQKKKELENLVSD